MVNASEVASAAVQLADASSRRDSVKADFELNPWPSFIQDRLQLWHKYMARYQDELASKTQQDIEISLPDGKALSAKSWSTTPNEIAERISKSLANQVVIAKVNGELWDLDRPFEESCSLELLKFDHEHAQQVYWHSTAHVLGEAAERYFGGCLCYGPPIENGFYYDMYMEDRTVVMDDWKKLEAIMALAIKEKQPFERLELTKAELMEMFKYNKFKLRILQEKVTTEKTTVYRCGPLIDLCRGPHVRHTGKIKAIKVTKNSSTYWEGNSTMETLQRIYGISFPDSKMLNEWVRLQAEAAARDHRKIGRDQELFTFHALSPGSAFFHPKGTYVYNTLVEFLRQEYRRRGYKEVITPNIYNSRLWETSGHWQHYAKSMFRVEIEKEQFGLKPMNCPGHCLMFAVRPRTFKELPIRYADFGVLHRNELSGALTGLTRVRRFQQDDAHIFCRPDQIRSEIEGCLEFLKCIYDKLGFEFKLFLSTRPEDYLGELDVWDQAEEQLRGALENFGQPWTLNPGDGAFYGPKIDILVMDAMKRAHQCATVQLDFQLPIRFDLRYLDEEGAAFKPVIVHRAILGSIERMIAVLTEHYGGKWPFWLSPRQAIVVPVHQAINDYAIDVADKLYAAGFECERDVDAGDTFNKKVRNAQLAQYNFILVAGEKERINGTVNVRTRDNKVHGEIQLEDLINRFKRLKEDRVEKSEEQL